MKCFCSHGVPWFRFCRDCGVLFDVSDESLVQVLNEVVTLGLLPDGRWSSDRLCAWEAYVNGCVSTRRPSDPVR